MRNHKKAVVSFSILISFLFVAIVVKLYFVQILAHKKLYSRSLKTSVRTYVVKGKRGTIFDSKGVVLAESNPEVNLAVDPAVMKNKEKMAEILSDVLKIKKSKILKIFNRKGHFFYIKKGILSKQIKEINNYKQKFKKEFRALDKNKFAERRKFLDSLVKDFRLLIFVDGFKRFYPQGELFANVLGFVRKSDGKGLEGVEFKYDKFLQGKDIKIKRKYSPRKGLMSTEIEKELGTGVQGNLYLTVDSRIQFIAEDELNKMMNKIHALWGGVVIMDPTSGRILAMANTPSFLPSKFYKSSPRERRNYTVANLFEPGSTMKVFSIFSVINENLVKPGEIIFGENGRYKFGGRWIHDHEKLQWITIEDVVAFSSNIGTVKLVNRLSSKKFYDYLTLFGFGRKTGINIPSESARRIRPYKKWYPIDKANLAFGQGISVNMVQMVRAFSAIYNGGVLWKPIIVDKIVNPKNKKILFQSLPVPQHLKIKYGSAERMKKYLQAVVDRGTAKRARIKGIPVGGKTGTSQKYDPTIRRYSWKKVVCSFIGAVPNNNPKMVMLVVFDQPKGREFGGTVSAPVFKNIAKRVLPLMGVYPENEDKEKKEIPIDNFDDTTEYIPEKEGKTVSPLDMVVVPNFVGMSLSDAAFRANKVGLELILSGKGSEKIVKQYPESSSVVSFGTAVTVETYETEKSETN